MTTQYPIIWLLRHSIREELKDHVKLSITDLPITTEGQILAHTRAQELKKLINTNSCVKFYVSPYRRTLETAFIFASYFPGASIELSALISEAITPFIDKKEDANKTNISVPPNIKPYLASVGIIPPEIKSEVLSRLKTFIDTIKNNKEDHVIVVSHAAVITTILSLLFCEEILNFPNYCGCIAIQYNGTQWNQTFTNWQPMLRNGYQFPKASPKTNLLLIDKPSPKTE